MTRHLIATLSCLAIATLALSARAQQLEPRRWGHLPDGAQFVSIAYLYTDGEIFFDPVLRIEDAKMELHTLNARYVYSFGLADRSARFEADVPYVHGRWQGLVNGEFQATERDGFADPRLRLSVLLYGAPALSPEEFVQYRGDHPVNTIVGAGLSLKLPLGEYFPDRLINVGGNRFILRPELGILHTRRRISYELTGSMSVFGNNDEFWPGDSTRSQDPLYLLQGHIVHTLRRGIWASASAGYGFGGESRINGQARNDDHDNYFWALTLGMPVTSSQRIKLTYAGLRTNNLVGIDSDNILLAWSMLY